MQIFPVTNPWNECISTRPVLPNWDAMIAQIMSNLSPSHRTLVVEYEMNFVLLPDRQPRMPGLFFQLPGRFPILDGGISPQGLYPVPPNLPVETWPSQTGRQTLAQWQTNDHNGSDRHAIIGGAGRGLHLGNVGNNAGRRKLARLQRRKV